MLRAHGYRRTSHLMPLPGDSRASYATAPIGEHAPRRGGLGRSLLLAASLGAVAGGGLVAWDFVDPASAAPVKSAAYDALDSAIHAFKQVGSAAAPYIDQVVNAVQGTTSATKPSAAAQHVLATPAQLPAKLEPTVAPPTKEEEEKAAKIILLEGVKSVAEEEEDDDDNDDVDAVVASSEDATTPTFAALTHPTAYAVPAADGVMTDAEREAHEALMDRVRALEEVTLRRHLEQEEAKAEEEAELKRKERQRALAAEEKKMEEARQEEERERAAEEERKRKALADAESERKAAEERRKASLREQYQRRRDETEKLREAAVKAKHKREETEATKLHERVPPGMLSPTAGVPTLATDESLATHAPKAEQPKIVAVPAVPTEEVKATNDGVPRKGESHGRRKGHHDEMKMDAAVVDLMAAAAQKAKKEVQEKYNQLLQEKEALLKRVHAAELDAYTAQWQKTIEGTYSSIAKEISSRKYLNLADFAHLSAIFTGYISLKNALDKEQPFARELASLKGAIHDDLANSVIDSIPMSATAGVPTLQRITTSFEQQLVPAVRQVAYTVDDEGTYPMPVQQLRRIFAWYVLGSFRIRSPSEVTASHKTFNNAELVLAHTHEALSKGDLMSALRHIRHLPTGPVAAVGQQWAQGLHDRLVVEQATVIFDALIPPAK